MKFATSTIVRTVLLLSCIFTVPPVQAQESISDGLLRGEAGDFAGAIHAFQKELSDHPDSAEAHYNLGLALLANGGNIPPWNDALVQFRAATALQPAYAAAHRMAGVALLESGDAAKATPELKLAVDLAPASAEAHFDLGRALTSAGETSAAHAEYLAALKLKSPYPDAEYALGKELLSQRMFNAAIDRFNAALAWQPDFESAHYGLAQALKAEGQAGEAEVEFKAARMLLQRQSDVVLSSRLSNESLDRAKQGDMQSAFDSARKALWLNPANALANFNLGLLLADTGNFSASIHQIKKAISLAPFRAQFYVDLARVQERAGDGKGAAATRGQAQQIDPRSPAKTAGDHLAFATQLSTEGDFLGALGEMRQALMLSPTRSDIRYSYAVAAIQIGRKDEAEYELRNVLRLSPSSAPAHLALGSLLFEQKDMAGAAAEFRAVLRLQPGNAQASKLLAECEPHPPR